MTHTLHRSGSREELERDYIFIMMSNKGGNDKGSATAKKRFYEIAVQYDPVNVGDAAKGNAARMGGAQGIMAQTDDKTICHAVYRDPKAVAAVLRQINEENLNISVVVSGLFDKVEQCCGQAGLKPHTIEYSLGTWGKTDKMASGRELEVMTMCGHAMVPGQLVTYLADQVKAGRMSAIEAAGKASRMCTCGIFNTARAAEIIAAMAAG